MGREIENAIQPEVLEKMILSRYASQVGISFDELHDCLELNPHETFSDVFFDEWRDQVYYDTLTGFYEEMPGGDLEGEAFELMDDIHERTRDFLRRQEVLNDVEGANLLRGMNIHCVSPFAALMHGKTLSDAETELSSGKLTKKFVVRLVFWSRMHKITSTGVELLSISSSDSDLVLRGSQPDLF